MNRNYSICKNFHFWTQIHGPRIRNHIPRHNKFRAWWYVLCILGALHGGEIATIASWGPQYSDTDRHTEIIGSVNVNCFQSRHDVSPNDKHSQSFISRLLLQSTIEIVTIPTHLYVFVNKYVNKITTENSLHWFEILKKTYWDSCEMIAVKYLEMNFGSVAFQGKRSSN